MSIEDEISSKLGSFKTAFRNYMLTLTAKRRYTNVKTIDTPNEFFVLSYNIKTKKVMKVHVLLDMNKANLFKMDVLDIYCEDSDLKFDLERMIQTKELRDSLEEWKEECGMEMIEARLTS